MIAAGYIFKTVISRPAWLHAEDVSDLFSVSSCFSKDFTDCVSDAGRNEYWLFSRPADMAAIIASESISSANLKLFYFELYELEFDEEEKVWVPFEAPALETPIEPPKSARLEGFDVASITILGGAECSPLSCNHLAEKTSVNEHCLFTSFEDAKSALEADLFNACEPGPYRIFAVYTVDE